MPAVQILLASYNGMRFLAPQMESISAQTWPDIDLLVSDDGSTDGTREYLEDFCRRWTKGRATLIEGPRSGNATGNFRHLILNADPEADYVAFADQDDIWTPDKLANAIARLEAVAAGPTIVCSRTALIDAEGHPIGFSPLFPHKPDFRNALVQSVAGGNTMVMNRAAFDIMRRSSERTTYLAHDWWSYLIVTGAGGQVHYSPTPDTLYRQHDANEVGANPGWPARWDRLRKTRNGRFRNWCDQNVASLEACRDLLSHDAQLTLDRFDSARRGNMFERLIGLGRAGVYRQTRLGQAMLVVTAMMGWM